MPRIDGPSLVCRAVGLHLAIKSELITEFIKAVALFAGGVRYRNPYCAAYGQQMNPLLVI